MLNHSTNKQYVRKIAPNLKSVPHLVIMDTSGQVLIEQRTDQMEVRHWSQEETDDLIELNNDKEHELDYKYFAEKLPGRTEGQCRRKIQEILGMK